MSDAEFFRKKREEAMKKICNAWNHNMSCFICGRTQIELEKQNKKLQIEHLIDENIGNSTIEKSQGGSSNTYEVLNMPESKLKDNFDILCDDCNILKNSAIRELMIFVEKKDFDSFIKKYKAFLSIIPKNILSPAILATAKNNKYKIDMENKKIIKI